MNKTWIIISAILLFLIITFLYWKLTKGYVKKVYGKKMFNQWGNRMFYWQAVLFVSGGITVFAILILKSFNIFPS